MKKFIGLTTSEVEHSRKKHGSNQLTIKETETFWEVFLDAFKDRWIIILLIALCIKLAFNGIGFFFPEIVEVDWYEPLSLLAAILAATYMATASQIKGARELRSLQEEGSKFTVATYRNGELTEVSVDDLVVGDEILVQAGQKIPVDGYILEGRLKVNQATLNGESEDATKIELGEQTLPESNDLFSELKVFRGTLVTSGEAVIKATSVGDKTILGSINASLQEDGKESPSKEKLNRLADQIGIMGYSAGALYFVIAMAIGLFALYSSGTLSGMEVFQLTLASAMFGVIIVIMAVPEGLPMMLAMVASMNARKLLKDKILVVNPENIEAAGYTKILFSDKTGTITQGILSVVDIVEANGTIHTGLSQASDNFKQEVINAIGLNNDAVVTDKKEAIGSNNTDRALLQFLIDNDMLNFNREYIVEKEQFNSDRKQASITLENGTTYIKGAAEVLLNECSHYLENGEVKAISQEIVDRLTQISLEQAERSMRLLALSKRENNQTILIGLVCIRDNLREGMTDTINELHQAGVQVVMVTGDRKETAMAIAKEAGIYKPEEGDLVLTHDELSSISDEELKQKLNKLKVVSRALPDDKKRLIKVAQELDIVCAMTGDGSNDGPALKAADVGFAMGDGTEVAKEASDIVILNNSLSSIEKAILNGRAMTKSVQKFIIFQLTVNVATIAVSLISPLLGFREPFTVIQILWINLIMDTLAALAFGGEPAQKEYMLEKPIERKSNIVTNYMKSHIGMAALFITAGVLGLFVNAGGIHNFIFKGVATAEQDMVLRTFIFTFFIYAILFNSLNTRTTHFNLFKDLSQNKRFIWVMLGIAVGQTIIIQYGGKVFSTVPMDIMHFLAALGLASLIIPFDFIRKAILNCKP